MNGPLPLPPVLSAKLSDFRRRVWWVKLAEGVGASIAGLAVSYGLVLVLDRFMETPAWLRAGLLVLGAAVPGIGLPLKWHRWVWRQRRLEDAARLLRWKFPRLGDQLLGIVELARHDDRSTGRSERLVQAAMAQADEAVREQDFTGAVPRARHRQWAWAAAGSLALVAAGFAGMGDAARNALLRWLMPWRDTERFTFARVAELPDPLVVPLAEPFALPVTLTPDSRWSPRQAAAFIAGQPEVTAPLAAGAYQLSFPPARTDARLDVKVGDVRRTVQLQPRPRPELTSLKVRLKLPDYLEYQSRPELDVRGGTASILKGSEAVFEAEASRDLLTAEIDGQPARTEGGRLISAARSIDGAGEVRFTWKDSLGLTARVPLVLQVIPLADEAPRIVARRDSLEQVVLETEVVLFEVSASDDFGIRKVGLEWKTAAGGEAKAPVIRGSKVTAAGAPENREVSARASFCAAREGVGPQTLEVRAWAEDYLPGRDPGRSATFVLHILNPSDHALWVTQQMGKWLEAARETYEREQQLHQINKELRGLTAADLDRPDNRRRVALQSSAENANAVRLTSLNQAGRHLVEQATKNPEFDAPRLESWATMLKSLQDIASNRMPNVADLLKQSADAKAGARLAQASPGKPGAPAGAAPQGSPATGKPGEGSKPPQPTASRAPESTAGNPGQKEGVPADSRSAPTIAQGPQPPQGKGPAETAATEAKPKDPAPSIKLTESTMNPPPVPPAGQSPAGAKPPGAGSLKLPVNSLAAAPGAQPEPAPPAETPAQESLDQGVTSQKELLAEFAKVSDELTGILASLEASTFVKRFKAAAREQIQLASGISQKTLDAFGVVREESAAAAGGPTNFVRNLESAIQAMIRPPSPAVGAEGLKAAEVPALFPARIAPMEHFVTTYAPQARRKARDQSDFVRIIQSDLESYFQRKPDQHFKKVLGEMKQSRVVQELGRVGDRAADNLSGSAVHAAEYWADTMDRWAEEMVAAGKCSNCSSCSSDSLPPEIVLKVMQALRDEMKLRDETRELENSRQAIAQAEHGRRSGQLAAEQLRITTHTAVTVEDILALPEGSAKFGKELKLLGAVVRVMEDARSILAENDTSGRAIAAETEAIELLLQTKRQKPPGGGGGGGGDPGGGGTAATASSAALADLGPGGDGNSLVQARPVGQATGRAGREFPEEFKTGLDAYFNNLESTATP